MPMMGQEMKMTSDVVFAAPDKFRMENTMEGMPAGTNIVISDGETVWTHMPTMGMTQKIDIKRVKETLGEDHPLGAGMSPNQQSANFSDPFGGFAADSIEYLTTEPVGGVDCHVFEATITTPPGMEKAMGMMAPRKAKIWLSKDDGMLRRQILFNSDGTRMMEMTYTDVQINPEVDESLFEYTPKPDENVMDVTEMVLKMSEQFGKKAPAPEGGETKPDEGSGPKSEGSDTSSETLERGI
jgi:outer membrane lipoprotein-sorting protein